jgi:hypothetical protein
MSQPMAKDLGKKVSRYQDNTTKDDRPELTSEGFADGWPLSGASEWNGWKAR